MCPSPSYLGELKFGINDIKVYKFQKFHPQKIRKLDLVDFSERENRLLSLQFEENLYVSYHKTHNQIGQ
jgi:hypothetical protein